MKNFVIKYGSVVVNIVAIMTFIGLLISSVGIIMNQGIGAGLVSLWAGITGFVAVFFMIYIAMSINDHLYNIQQNYSNKY